MTSIGGQKLHSLLGASTKISSSNTVILTKIYETKRDGIAWSRTRIQPNYYTLLILLVVEMSTGINKSKSKRVLVVAFSYCSVSTEGWGGTKEKSKPVGIILEWLAKVSPFVVHDAGQTTKLGASPTSSNSIYFIYIVHNIWLAWFSIFRLWRRWYQSWRRLVFRLR